MKQKCIPANRTTFRDIAILTGLILFNVIADYFWLRRDNIIPLSKACGYFCTMMDYYDCLKKFGGINPLAMLDLLKDQLVHNPHGPAYNLTGAFLMLLFDKSVLKLIIFNNTPYVILLIVSTYLLGRHIADQNTGLAAAVLLALYPAVFGTSRMYILEFATMGVATLSQLILLKSESFSKRGYSILYGVSAAWGMLIKSEFIAFIIGPLIYVLLRTIYPMSVARSKAGDRRRLLNFFFACGAFCLLAGIRFPELYFKTLGLAYEPAPRWFNFELATLDLYLYQLGGFFFLVFLMGAFYFFRNDNTKADAKIILASWILIPWTILVMAPHQANLTYTLPYLPSIALISAIGSAGLSRKVRHILMAITLIIGLVQYYDFSFDGGPCLDRGFSWRGHEISYFRLSGDMCRRAAPTDEQSNIDAKILSFVERRLNRYPAKRVLMAASFAIPNYDITRWTAIKIIRKLPFVLELFPVAPPSDVIKRLSAYDFILTARLSTDPDLKSAAWFENQSKKIAWRNSSTDKRFHLTGEEMEKLKSRYVSLMKGFRCSNIYDQNKMVVSLCERPSKGV